MSYHAEWIVALIERRQFIGCAYARQQANNALLRHVRALFNEGNKEQTFNLVFHPASDRVTRS